ncbi:RHS repeat-associated core domain-containing protein [Lysinibacillus sp. RS5]
MGQYHDLETGLYYNRFRYYDLEMGMYTQQDPIGLASNNPTLYGYGRVYP